MINKIIYASDYRGVDLKEKLLVNHDFLDLDFENIGIDHLSKLDYIDISKRLANKLENQPHALGVIICGSGQGVAIALNRFKHIKAVMCRTVEDAMQTRRKLNANIICLGSKYCSDAQAKEMISAFVSTEFEGGKHLECEQKLAVNQTSHLSNGVNLIVRAIIIHEGHILLTTTTSENYDFAANLFFLPGGHVEYNEPALDALRREIWEEMNLEVEEAKFAGAVECSWDRKGSIYHELNLVYAVNIKNLSLANPPIAMDHKFHKFVWQQLDQIDQVTILPEKLKTIIRNSVNQSSNIEFLSQMIKPIKS